MWTDLPDVCPVDEDFGSLCAVNHCCAWNMHGVLQVLVQRVGDEHEVRLAGADVFEAHESRV